MNETRNRIVCQFLPMVAVAFAVIVGCKTETDEFDFARTERGITKAIASGQYDVADRLISEEESEAAGGCGCDSRDLRWAMVKVKLGQYAEASNLVEEVLLYANSPCRDSALELRNWLAEQQDATHNKTQEPGVVPAPQVQR